MAITKTKFINYVRCPRFVALEDIKKEKLDSLVTIEEYKKEEEEEKILELLGNMENIDEASDHLKTMLPYYNKVELLAGSLARKYFKGDFKYSKSTYNQESFDAVINNIRYLCYVDIYNEYKDNINIIEVKATTDKKYLDFMEKKNGIYILKENSKLYDRYTDVGHYIYDIAVQRFIIENDFKNNNIKKNVKYYLAVLNSKYVFNGKYENNEPIYDTMNGEDIISFIDVTDITKNMMNQIYLDSKKIEEYINNLNGSRYPLGKYCEYKKTVKCKYCSLCFDILPEKHSILSYIDNHHGFKKGNIKYDVYDLINEGKVSMLDINEEYLNREKNKIQRRCLINDKEYININKIKDGIKQIKYPIYHLDFETFPCPLPRFKGERPYTQSVFQFSLHIEKEEGKCDLVKDHYGYLAKDLKDHRLDLVKEMCALIGDGTVLVYNDSFEKTRLKELSEIYPEYKDKLLKIRNNVFDLMNIVKTNSKFYESLGYTKEEAKLFNYYHKDLDGSFSIKKVLPLFSNLTYKGMEVGNGVEAMITYASFDKLNEEEYKYKYQKLVEYCRQDTYAMYEVLKGLKNVLKNVK